MKLRALLIIVFLAVGLPWPVGAVTREELVCPLRADWGAQEWEQWEKEERESVSAWSDKCPCQQGWKPTEEQLREMLEAHEGWVDDFGWHSPDIPGRAVLCYANLEHANLQNAVLKRANLWKAELGSAVLTSANLEVANLREVFLGGANLQKADLKRAGLYGARLWSTDLQEADLGGGDLRKADFRFANLRKAKLEEANLENADLRYAKLQEAYLVEVHIQNATLAYADLEGATYAPASRPPGGYLEGITGLASVVIPYDEETKTIRTSGMVQLRKLLHEAGLRERERQATYAIEHNKALHAREHGSGLEQFGGWLLLVFFEWTTGWGLYPSRAFFIMLGLLLVMAVVYFFPIKNEPKTRDVRSGIYRIWPSHRLEPSSTTGVDMTAKAERLSAGILTAIFWALYFSILSAFHIGWRDINAGSWLTRTQFTEYTLRGLGWFRFFSGLQSLISVYLVAMCVLTYFGRPFQ